MRLLSLIAFALLLSASAYGTPSTTATPESSAAPALAISTAHPSAPLTGTWRFRAGDDPRWSQADYDDDAWEAIDLTPEPGAHDGDVGVTGYLQGWGARGHERYWGFAWYRKHVSVLATSGTKLALLAPNDIEDAYQLFCNGTLLGQDGDFSGKVPTAYSARPSIFPFPQSAQGRDVVVSIRVWMGPQTDRGGDSGGIHVVPVLGERQAIAALYRSQWMEILRGYIVDAIEPVALLLLAGIAWLLARRAQTPAFHYWLCTALLLTTVVRGNQAFFVWTDGESLSAFLFAKYVVLMPLGIAAWAMTWLCWLNPMQRRWQAAGVIVAACATAAMIASASADAGIGSLGPAARNAMALLFLATAILAAATGQRRDRAFAIGTMLLVGIGQFAGELSSLGVPGIWFPFGVGVSRTQYAYAALILWLGGWLIRDVRRNDKTIA